MTALFGARVALLRVALLALAALLWIAPAASVVLLSADPAGATSLSDAELLALEISAELLPPPALVDRIDHDLAEIRLQHPYFQHFHAFPDWFPGILLVELTPAAWAQHEAGEYQGWDVLNAEYGLTIDPDLYPRPRHVRLTFELLYNPALLADIYSDLPGVVRARPSLDQPVDSDIFADVPAPGVYSGIFTFQEGWSECTPEGCFLRYHYWVLAVSATGADIIEDYGEPLPVDERTWGGIKLLYRDRD